MYAYCGNNPVMRVDPTGQFWSWLQKKVEKTTNNILQALFVLEECIMAYCDALIGDAKKKVIEDNTAHNSKLDADPETTTKNDYIESQKDKSDFNYGLRDVGYNGCEVIAVHNAKVAKGIESSLSETIRDFQDNGAMVGFGALGSNPFKIGNVLADYDIDYTTVSLDQMTEDGVYIVSYWTPHSSGLYQIHTIMVEYDGNTYNPYNKTKKTFSPEEIGKYYICGYYLG